MPDFNKFYNLINAEIESIQLPDKPELLYLPIKYTLNSGGKRIRPVLTLLACNLFTDKLTAAINPAIAIEIFHNFTLLHDDIMDKSDMRRNNLTVHKKWNENIAILSGDAMMIKAYEYILKTPEEFMPKVFDIFNKTSLEVCEGQQFDMDFENLLDVTTDEYLEMIRLKTSVLIAASLKIGAICGRASQKNAELLSDFGMNIGIAFQLQDDLLDVFGNKEIFGKTTGNDIYSNKKTYLLLQALEVLKGNDREKLLFLLQNKEVEKDEKINLIKFLYEKAGVEKITKNKIEDYFLRASKTLNSVSVKQEKKKDLEEFIHLLMIRKK